MGFKRANWRLIQHTNRCGCLRLKWAQWGLKGLIGNRRGSTFFVQKYAIGIFLGSLELILRFKRVHWGSKWHNGTQSERIHWGSKGVIENPVDQIFSAET